MLSGLIWKLLFGDDLIPRTVRTSIKTPRSSPSGLRVLPPPRPSVVRRQSRPLWQEKGFMQRGNSVEGYIRARTRAYRCCVLHPFSTQAEFHVEHVPREVLSGPHGACFSEVSRDLFRVHFSPWPDLDTGLLRIEQTFREAGL